LNEAAARRGEGGYGRLRMVWIRGSVRDFLFLHHPRLSLIAGRRVPNPQSSINFI
jgi:hypothetical protein